MSARCNPVFQSQMMGFYHSMVCAGCDFVASAQGVRAKTARRVFLGEHSAHKKRRRERSSSR